MTVGSGMASGLVSGPYLQIRVDRRMRTPGAPWHHLKWQIGKMSPRYRQGYLLDKLVTHGLYSFLRVFGSFVGPISRRLLNRKQPFNGTEYSVPVRSYGF